MGLPAVTLVAALMTAGAAPAQESDERLMLLQRGEAALASGATDEATALFDRAALMRHSADTELDLVRAYLQAGQYRRALAFAAHVAGAHSDEPEAAAQYAWLLRAGGQGTYAQRVLEDAMRLHAANPVLTAVQAQLGSAQPRASGLLLETPHRLAPLPLMRGHGALVDAAARSTASAVLVGEGQALAPLPPLIDAAGIWVRNGLGETTEATVERRYEDLDLALLRLRVPDRYAAGLLQAAKRDPYAGSPALLADYVPGATPAWPMLSIGFLGPQSGASGALGIAVPDGALGGPVFDAAGGWIGVALRDASGAERLVPISRLRALGLQLDGVEQERAQPMPVDLLYERALRTTLQLIVTR